MGSVLDYVTCPHCGSMAYNDYYYKSGEDYTWCCECGYYHSYERSNNEYKETIIDNPYGYYHASFVQTNNEFNRSGIGGPLETKEKFDEIVKSLLEHEPDLESIKLSRFVENKIVLKEVYNRQKFFRKEKLKKINGEIR